MGVFMLLFQSNISQWIHKLKAPYLSQNNVDYLVYYMSKNISIIKTFSVSKHKKSSVHFFFQNSKLGSTSTLNNWKMVSPTDIKVVSWNSSLFPLQ